MKSNLPIKKTDFCSECLNCANTNQCLKCTRKYFVSECVPLTNVINARINILNWEKNNYMWYDGDESPTFTINKNFELEAYEGEKIYRKSIKINDYLISNLHKNIVINMSRFSFEVPIYYMFVNKNNNIFDIYINFFLHKNPEYKNNDDKKIAMPFIYDSNKKFVSLTYKFNIFNLSIMCNKFFDIFLLFLNDFDYYFTKKTLQTIFDGYNLVNLYLLINHYKTNLDAYENTGFNNKDCPYNEFMSSQIKEYPSKSYKSCSNAKKIKNIETGEKTITLDEIYKELTDSIVEYRKYLGELSALIVDFDKIFLFSILKYRFNENTISNTWMFDLNYYIDYFDKHYTKNDNPYLFESLYVTTKPQIYEYSRVSYKGRTFGNCMENTILQFLKILFWSNELDDYDYERIKKITNNTIKNNLIEIFENIHKEKTANFDIDWIDFIMKLQDKNNSNGVHKSYILSKSYSDVELKSCMANLILFMRYIANDELNKISDDTLFMENLVQMVDSEYRIEISSNIESNEEIAIITTDSSTYKMILRVGIHAKFENSINYDSNSISILSNMSDDYLSINYYLIDYKHITLSNINDYICALYVELPNCEFFTKYILNLREEQIFSAYKMFFNDDVVFNISETIFLKLLDPHIACFLNYYDNGMQLWYVICQNTSNNFKFWEKVVDNKLFKNWNDKTWGNSMYIRSGYYWENMFDYYIENRIFNTWKYKEWKIFIENDLEDKTWRKIIKNINIFKYFDDRTWHTAFAHLKYTKQFWYIVLCEKNEHGEGIMNDWNLDTWSKSTRFMSDCVFWNKVYDYELYKNWNKQKFRTDVWVYALENIKCDSFWNKVVSNNSILSTWDEKHWYEAFLHIKLESFWDSININELNIQNILNKQTIDLALSNIKSKKFWKEVLPIIKIMTPNNDLYKNYVDKINDIIQDQIPNYTELSKSGETDEIYKKKYLKYKQKYIQLKKNI